MRILRGLLGTGRIPTSYLFSGERGIGKFSAALEFAKAMNCESPAGRDSCDRCRSCMRMTALNHPDLKVMAPEGGVLKVEQVRELEEFLSFKPHEGRKKVVIVDDADLMNLYAANAFLKTLEEPPEDSMIILVSSRPELLVDTIRSRCLNIRFLPLGTADLKKAAELLGKKTGDETGLRLVMGRVGLLLDEEAVVRRDRAFDSFEDMIEGREAGVPKEREAIDELLDSCLLFLRDSMEILCTGGDETLVNRDLSGRIARICRGIGPEELMAVYDEVLDLRKKTFYNLNKAIVIQYLSMLLASLGRKRTRAR
ncbi:MAG: DNA polymerase III subunit delta' [bacterium]